MLKLKIYFVLFVLFLAACRKENTVLETNDDAIMSYDFLIDISSQWTVKREWQLGAPFPFDDYYYIDTTVYFFGSTPNLMEVIIFA